jgi:hypothetical protein
MAGWGCGLLHIVLAKSSRIASFSRDMGVLQHGAHGELLAWRLLAMLAHNYAITSVLLGI